MKEMGVFSGTGAYRRYCLCQTVETGVVRKPRLESPKENTPTAYPALGVMSPSLVGMGVRSLEGLLPLLYVLVLRVWRQL